MRVHTKIRAKSYRNEFCSKVVAKRMLVSGLSICHENGSLDTRWSTLVTHLSQQWVIRRSLVGISVSLVTSVGH